MNQWVDYITNNTVIEEAEANIGSNPGSCGYLNSIVTAFVVIEDPYEDQSLEAGEEGAGVMIKGVPLNDIEVRFIADGGDMYKLSDVPGSVPPLSNPHLTRTDDRGKTEIKWRTPLPTFCNFDITYRLSADIGVSRAYTAVSFMVPAWASTEETTDDDDDDDDVK